MPDFGKGSIYLFPVLRSNAAPEGAQGIAGAGGEGVTTAIDHHQRVAHKVAFVTIAQHPQRVGIVVHVSEQVSRFVLSQVVVDGVGLQQRKTTGEGGHAVRPPTFGDGCIDDQHVGMRVAVAQRHQARFQFVEAHAGSNLPIHLLSGQAGAVGVEDRFRQRAHLHGKAQSGVVQQGANPAGDYLRLTRADAWQLVDANLAAGRPTPCLPFTPVAISDRLEVLQGIHVTVPQQPPTPAQCSPRLAVTRSAPSSSKPIFESTADSVNTMDTASAVPPTTLSLPWSSPPVIARYPAKKGNSLHGLIIIGNNSML